MLKLAALALCLKPVRAKAPLGRRDMSCRMNTQQLVPGRPACLAGRGGQCLHRASSYAPAIAERTIIMASLLGYVIRSSWARSGDVPLIPQRHMDQVLRTALVKPAMNKAANTYASSRRTQPAAVSQAAVALAEAVVRSQSARATLVPTGRLRSSPTLTC